MEAQHVNNILAYIHDIVSKNSKSSPEIHVDLFAPASYTTVPIQCTSTTLKPDLCIFWPQERKIIIIELTVPFEIYINKAHERKSNKYAPLVSDIEDRNYEVNLVCLEVGSRGYLSVDNEKRLKVIHDLTDKSVKFKDFKNTISKLAILSSFSIFLCQKRTHLD